MAKATTAKKQDAAVTETNPQIDTATKSIERPTGEIQRVRSPQIFAATCPRNAAHKNTRIYKTDGKVRRCVCDDCGHTWKQIGEPADPLGAYCRELMQQMERLAEDPTTSADGEACVCLTMVEVLGIVDDLRLLLQ